LAALNPNRILRYAQGFRMSAILRAAVELGIFDRLAEEVGGSDAAAVAAQIGADARATRILLDALTAMGLVSTDTAGYHLTAEAGSFLVRGRPNFLGDILTTLSQDVMWEAFRRLPEAVRHGGSVLDEDAERPDHSFWRDYAETMAGVVTAPAETLAGILGPWAATRSALDLLDVGCGNGAYGFTIAARHPQARVTALDWPSVLEFSKEHAERLRVRERTTYLPGDMFTVDLGGPYDLAIVSNVFHHFSVSRCRGLLERIAAALKPDGRVVIQELLGDLAPPDQDPAPHLYSVMLMAWTREGEVHPLSAYEQLLGAAGFEQPSLHEAPGLPSRFLMADRVRA